MSTVSTSTSPTPEELAELEREIRAYVEDEGERWAQRIEDERQVPMELWDELRDRGYLRLTAPEQYGGRGIPLPGTWRCSRSSRCPTARCG